MRVRTFLSTTVIVLLAAFLLQQAPRSSAVSAVRSALPTAGNAKTVLDTTLRHREWVNVQDGVRAFIVYPERSDKAPVVVVTANKPEASDWTRAVSDQLAAEGFIGVVPDIAPPPPGPLNSSEMAKRIAAVRQYALALPASDNQSALLEFYSGVTGDRIRADIASPAAGDRTATFQSTGEDWPRLLAFLNKQTANHPQEVQEDHSAHLAAMAMLQTPGGAPQAAAGYPTGKSPNLPAGRYTAKSTLANSKLRKEFVDIPVGNVKLHTWVEYPEGNGSAPIVVVMQHGLGLDEWQRALADQLALQGYIAIAPDLFSGLGPNGGNFDSFVGTDEVMRNAAKLTQDEGIRRYKAAYDWGMKLARANGKSATIGFCAGGGYSFRFAGEVPEVNAAVVFYGGTPSEEIMAKIKAPVLAFYGEDDARVTAAAEPTTATMKRLGKSFESHIYPHTTHAFLDYQSLGGNPAATADAWAKTTAFLKRYTN